MAMTSCRPCAPRLGCDVDTVTVTVMVGGWWLPRRALRQGETLTLDADTAQALARRGIVRMSDAKPPDAEDNAIVASNAGKPARKRPSKEPEQ